MLEFIRDAAMRYWYWILMQIQEQYNIGYQQVVRYSTNTTSGCHIFRSYLAFRLSNSATTVIDLVLAHKYTFDYEHLQLLIEKPLKFKDMTWYRLVSDITTYSPTISVLEVIRLDQCIPGFNYKEKSFFSNSSVTMVSLNFP